MKAFVVFALALSAAQALNYDQEWEIFKAKYERNYLSTPEVIPAHKTIYAKPCSWHIVQMAKDV